ncbi:MAG: hypothetical protein IRZ16_06165 [Myxococcaceae bacterium]|nr:hypothetical protein [Myxococcaceae bacterium]
MLVSANGMMGHIQPALDDVGGRDMILVDGAEEDGFGELRLPHEDVDAFTAFGGDEVHLFERLWIDLLGVEVKRRAADKADAEVVTRGEKA